MITVHYADGTFEGAWNDAHPWGIVAVSWPDDDVGRDFCYGRSFYFPAPWMGGEIISADIGGLWDYLQDTPLRDVPLAQISPRDLIDAGVKFGRTISTSEYTSVIQPLMHVHTVKRERLPERTLV